MKAILIKLLPYGLSIILGVGLVLGYQHYTQELNIQRQINATLGDSLKIIKREHSTLYQKYVNIRKVIDSEKAFADSKILILTNQTIKLNDIITKTKAEIKFLTESVMLLLVKLIEVMKYLLWI